MENSTVKEDVITNAIEKQTIKIPSDVFLFTAIGTMAISLTLKVMGRNRDAVFVGQWAAPILILGIYNKLVKQEEGRK